MRIGAVVIAVVTSAAAVVAARAGEGQAGGDAGPTASGSDAAPPSAAVVELGRRLFFDPRASRTGRIACSDCHLPEHGFADPRHPSIDEFGPSSRRTMPLTDLRDGAMHADGEFESVRALLLARLSPLQDLDEAGQRAVVEGLGIHAGTYGLQGPVPALPSVARNVAQDGLYDDAFFAAYGATEATVGRVVDALEAFTLSIRTAVSPYDRYLAGDPRALSPEAEAGLAIFETKGGCAGCHTVAPVDGRAPLTDGSFHDTGIAWRTARLTGARSPRDAADAGLGAHGARAADRRRDAMHFKTPSLRDVARRGPFMHDGSLTTLAEVVDYYDAGGAQHKGLDAALRPLALAPSEKLQLLAFLRALSADERPASAPPPAWLGRTVTLRLVTPDGAPIAARQVAVEPAGDVFRGVPRPEPLALRTDADGRLSFPFPASTHVRLRVAGHVVDGLVPDVARDATLLAVPVARVALRVLTDGTDVPEQVRAVPAPRVDEFGRVEDPRSGRTLVFELIRRIAPDEALYATDVPAGPPGSRRRVFVPRGADSAVALGQADMDLSPGALTTVDLRPVRGTPDATGPEARRRPLR